MRIGVIEHGGTLAKIFCEEASKRLEEASFQLRTAFDLFDVLAHARRMAGLDQLVIIVQLDPEEKDKNAAFYNGLAVLEAETGKPIFKLVYTSEEDGQALARELAETFINSLFFPEKEAAQPREDEEFKL